MNEPLLFTRVGYAISLSSRHASDLARDIFRVLRVMPGIRMPLNVVAPVELSSRSRCEGCCGWFGRTTHLSPEDWVEQTRSEPCEIDLVHITVYHPLHPSTCFTFRIRFFGSLMLSGKRIVAEWHSGAADSVGIQGSVMTEWESCVSWQTDACPTRIGSAVL